MSRFFDTKAAAEEYMAKSEEPFRCCMTLNDDYAGTDIYYDCRNAATGKTGYRVLRKIPEMYLSEALEHLREDLTVSGVARIVYDGRDFDVIYPKIIEARKNRVVAEKHRMEDGMLICEVISKGLETPSFANVEADMPGFYAAAGKLQTETPEVKVFLKSIFGGTCKVNAGDLFEGFVNNEALKEYISLVKSVPEMKNANSHYFGGRCIAERITELRDDLGFDRSFKGKINNEAFSLDEKQFILKDRKEAEKMISAYEERFVQNPTAENAAYFELAQTIKAGMRKRQQYEL